jgi:hypothetical protein
MSIASQICSCQGSNPKCDFVAFLNCKSTSESHNRTKTHCQNAFFPLFGVAATDAMPFADRESIIFFAPAAL